MQQTFGNLNLRVFGTHEKPLFVAKDICQAVGIKNPSQKLQTLADDEKDVICSTDTIGRSQEMLCVTEAGLYTLVLRCRDALKPGTLSYNFRRWVCHEVLPSIRRTGQFQLRQELHAKYQSERGRRLWVVMTKLGIWEEHIRKRYFKAVCAGCKNLCYRLEDNALYVPVENLQHVRKIINETLSSKVLNCVPAEQKQLTDFWN